LTVRRRVLLVLGALAATFVLPAAAWAKYRGTDVLGGLGPHAGWGAGPLMNRYPLSAYHLDYYVNTGLAPTNGQEFMQLMASVIFRGIVWLDAFVIQLVAWAFGLDLFHAVLAPLSNSMRRLYESIGQFWLVAAVAVMATWAVIQGLVRRRYSEVLTAVAVSAGFLVIAWVMIYSPETTLGRAADVTHATSLGVLQTVQPGAKDPRAALTDSLFREMVVKPHAAAEFGGLDHCSDASHPDADGFPDFTVSAPYPPGTICRNVLHTDAHGYGGYEPRFLAADDSTRDLMYQAMRDGTIDSAVGLRSKPCVLSKTHSCPNPIAGFRVDKADAGAADAMQAGGASDRFLMVLLIAFASIMIDRVLALLAAGIILAGLFALGLFSLAGVMVLFGLIPGRGHAAFKAWLGAGAVTLFIGVAYAVALAALVTIMSALTPETGTLGWGAVFGLQGALCWAAFRYRHKMAHWLSAKSHHEGTRKAVRRIEHPVQSVGAAYTAAKVVTRKSSRRTGTVTSTAKRRFDEHVRRRNPLPKSNGDASHDGQRRRAPDGRFESAADEAVRMRATSAAKKNGKPPVSAVEGWPGQSAPTPRKPVGSVAAGKQPSRKRRRRLPS
jgi:hypothetical protein